MKKKKIIGIVLMVIFTAAAIVSAVMFARQYSDAKASVDTFDDLAGLVVNIETPLPETPDETDEPAELTEEELAVYKRGRNASPKCTPKNGTVGDYHSATGLEALFGYLYLSGEDKRLERLFSEIIKNLDT